jgi:hypothetical protein
MLDVLIMNSESVFMIYIANHKEKRVGMPTKDQYAGNRLAGSEIMLENSSFDYE